MPINAAMTLLEPAAPIAFEHALQCVGEVCAEQASPAQTLALADALGAVLALDVVAPHDQPPFANSAMDGYAVRGADLGHTSVRLQLIGRILAGAEHLPTVASGECLGITTGAPMPPGADTVIIKEVVTLDGNDVIIPAGQQALSHVRAAGEDMQQGQLVLRAGCVLQPRHIALLAALGQAHVRVRAAPRLAIFSSGDEVLSAGEALRKGHIYNSNGPMLRAQAMRAGAKVVGCDHLQDDPER
ncbi:MAG: molybdopterin molybdotransferase MoeA, partial [Xanthomonadales bacterium]|nr:molybdopterin molybdotransferase MoeA [Xanthomonadales bacterium]